MPTIIKGQPTSQEVIAELRVLNEPVLLAFSCGKDSLACWIALEDAGIEVIPAYLWYVPNLEFIDEQIEYFKRVFGKKINRYPHPSFYGWINTATDQPPERCRVIESAGLPSPTYEQMWGFIKDDLGIPKTTWIADGVRAADSIVRRASFVKHGVMKSRSYKVSPIADWLKAEVMAAIERKGVELPIDYKLFGRSFDGIDRRFTEPLMRELPEDFERLREWFPFIVTDLIRGGIDAKVFV